MFRSAIPRWRDRLYPDTRSRDSLVRFRELLDARVDPGSRVLEIGAGAGARVQHDLKGRCAELVGVDMDPRVVENPRLDRGLVVDGRELPFEDASFDVAFCIAVLEHVEDPASFLSELARVLRPGGVFLALTPSRWHYVSLIAALTPLSFHRFVNRRRGRPNEDTFPTHYRLNTRRALEREGESAGLPLTELECLEVAPTYLSFSLPSYLLGACWERLVNAGAFLSPLRANLLATHRSACHTSNGVCTSNGV